MDGLVGGNIGGSSWPCDVPDGREMGEVAL